MGSREVDMNNERCSFEEDELPEELAHIGAITAMLEEKHKYYMDLDSYKYHLECAGTINDILPQVKALEEAQQKKIESLTYALLYNSNKAKEEERERIVGILEEMLIMRGLENDYSKGKTFGLQEAITRINQVTHEK